jgi:glyoxylase-like metal-dependent hydrolase (beta-lactamase superfamily II)
MSWHSVRRLGARQLAVGGCLLTLVSVTGAVRAEQAATSAPQIAQPNLDEVEIRVLPVQRNVYMLLGAGGNTAVQVGNDGVLVVDTQFAPLAPKILAAIRKLSDKPIRIIINTHVHGDHTGGNEPLAKTSQLPVRIMAHENVLKRMTAPNLPSVSEASLPLSEYFTPTRDFFFNGEAIVLHHVPAAHTDGDSLVFFRGSDVVITGDLFTPGGYPVIDLQNGGSVQGLIAGLNRILELTVPAKYQEGGTYVVPGHGRLCDEAEVVEYRDMVTIIRDRIQDLIKKGMTLERVKAARPTRDYDTEYGTTTGFWTTDMFVEAVYRSLGGKK